MDNSSKVRTGSNAVKLTLAKAITLIVGMASSMLLSRFRTLTEYGTYSQLLMVINLASSLFMLGLPNCINYFLGKSKTDEERAKFLSSYYTLSTILSFLVGLVLVLSVPLIENYLNNEYIKVFWYFLATYPWTKVVMSSTENLLIAYNKTTIMMVYKVLNSISLLGAILIVQVTGGTFTHYMLLFLGVEIVFTVWTYILAKKNALTLRLSLNKQMIKTILTFSVPIGLASMVGTINIELDKMVITSFFSTEELAIYTNASKELPVTIIATSITAVLMPQVVKLLHNDSNEEAVNLWKSATTISFAIISFISMACVIFAPEIITVLYSEKYLPGTSIFMIYSILLLLRCTYFGLMLNATGNTRLVFYSSIGSLLLNVSLNYLFYRLIGFSGPAIATLLSTVIMAVIQLLYTSKKISVKFSVVFPWKSCLGYLVLNLILAIIIYFSKVIIETHSEVNNIVLAVLLGILWFVFYVAVVFKSVKKKWDFLNKER